PEVAGSDGSAAVDAGTVEIDLGEVDVVTSGEPPRKPPPRTAAEASYRAGLEAFGRGDNAAALAHLRRAQQGNPGFAPIWRNLGLVYERLGELPQARIAFIRYLELVPTASDAPSIRLKLEKLGK
ncbi:MAG: tetratricopeptide repeat protein, partial [Deltaproteobacteria bacterium]|nr:tetratricopeptide repeat protein [Deltaproteobacteria bacterium]